MAKGRLKRKQEEKIMEADVLVVLAVYGLGVYVLGKYILPFVWHNILKPIGKMAYIVILFIGSILFFVSIGVFKEYGLSDEMQYVLAVIGGISVGIQWAKRKI